MIPSIPTPPEQLPKVPHSARSEHGEQAALFQWIETQIPQYPEFALIAAIPNGGYRPGKWKYIMQQEGQRPGVADVFWPMPKDNFAGGLLLENKTETGKLSKIQKAWRNAILCTPALYQSAHGFAEMKTAIEQYHALPWPKGFAINLYRHHCRAYWDEVLRSREARKTSRRKKMARIF